MTKVGLISDTHSYFDPKLNEYFIDRDEIWHAGDFGSVAVAESLQKIADLKGVYGNIDGTEIRKMFPKQLTFEREGVSFWITHIGGTYKRYCVPIREEMDNNPPDVFICGHSHILKIGRDKEKNNMLYINPGAAGKHGFHEKRTCIRFDIDAGKLKNMEVIEMGGRT
ncbi:MAG TPA: metallophosphoesterase family protein [Balneolaceae bacterium]|nr:metallophosphoesterase family protein [Balneolaceae bacterium]